MKTVNNMKIKSTPLKRYIRGLKGIDLNILTMADEDFVNNVMNISIYDLPSWIKSKAKFKLKMSKEDIDLVINYFKRLEDKVKK